MSYEYVEEELELKTKEKVYKFRTPSAFEQKQLSKKFKDQNKLKDDEKDDPVDLYINFFKELGLPEAVLNKLSFKGILGLFEYAVGAKKN